MRFMSALEARGSQGHEDSRVQPRLGTPKPLFRFEPHLARAKAEIADRAVVELGDCAPA